jgi:hypothetical protein
MRYIMGFFWKNIYNNRWVKLSGDLPPD